MIATFRDPEQDDFATQTYLFENPLPFRDPFEDGGDTDERLAEVIIRKLAAVPPHYTVRVDAYSGRVEVTLDLEPFLAFMHETLRYLSPDDEEHNDVI